jgi:uncharacterized peroxidase-related enzyme
MKMDYRTLLLEDRARAMLDFAMLITRNVHAVTAETITELTGQGLSDEDILNVVQVTGFFNYYTRLADALGVDPEPGMGRFPK